MSRDWFAVYARLLRLPKFRRLSDSAQLALFYVWALAGDEAPEATWTNVAALEDLLELHGRQPQAVAELVAAGWLDVDPSGRVNAHDWDEWQHVTTKQAADDWRRLYMREWRKSRKADTPPPAPPPLEERTEQYITVQGISPVITRDHRTITTVPGNGRTTTKKGPEPTCPRCGDETSETDPNVTVVEGGRYYGHRVCPTLEAAELQRGAA